MLFHCLYCHFGTLHPPTGSDQAVTVVFVQLTVTEEEGAGAIVLKVRQSKRVQESSPPEDVASP